jgi:hypothetical protein
MQVNGNTPTGGYEATSAVDTGAWNQTSYGSAGAIRLSPVSGNAASANRSGLLIHSGAEGGPGYWRGENELRATHGCVRLRKTDMERLVTILFRAGENPAAMRSEPVRVNVSVTDHAMSFNRPR